MSDLKTRLRGVDRIPAPDLRQEIMSRQPKTPEPALTRRLLVAAFALAITFAAVAFVVYAFSGNPQRRHVPATPWVPHPRLTAEITVGDAHIAGGIAVADGATWVGVQPERGTTQPALLRIDQATDKVVASIPLRAPVSRHNIASDDGTVWVATAGWLDRIDPAMNTVAASVRLPYGAVGAIAADGDAVWIELLTDRSDTGQDDLATLVRIDPTTNAIAARISLGTLLTGYEDHIGIGAGSIWLLGSKLINNNTEDGGDLIRVDPVTNQIAATIPVDGFGLGVGNDAVWVTSPADGLFDSSDEKWVTLRVDPSTNGVSAPFDRVLNGIVAVTDDGIWLTDYDRQQRVVISRINPETLDVDVAGPRIESYFTDAVFDGGSRTIWVSGVRSVYRVDLD